MSNATSPAATSTPCKRCAGEGMGQHKHIARGACFVCGRTGETAATREALRLTRRERSIADLRTALSRAAQEKAAGTLAAWWQDANDASDDMPTIKGMVKGADADVAARARAAFARLGLAA